MSILDDEDGWAPPRQCLEETAERQDGAFGRSLDVREAERGRDPLRDDRSVGLGLQQPRERLARLAARGLADHPAERPEGQPLTVREAASDQRRRSIADLPRQL